MVETYSSDLIFLINDFDYFIHFFKLLSKNYVVQNTFLGEAQKGSDNAAYKLTRRHTQGIHIKSGGLQEEALEQSCISHPDIYGYNVCLWKAPFFIATQIEQNLHRCSGANSVLKQTYTVYLYAAEHAASQQKLDSPSCGQLKVALNRCFHGLFSIPFSRPL